MELKVMRITITEDFLVPPNMLFKPAIVTEKLRMTYGFGNTQKIINVEEIGMLSDLTEEYHGYFKGE